MSRLSKTASSLTKAAAAVSPVYRLRATVRQAEFFCFPLRTVA